MKRRTKVPERVVELLEDLETLTGMTVDEWEVTIDQKEYPADTEILKELIPISPHEYREENEDEKELNEMRHRAGLDTVNLHGEPDSELKAFISMAGL